MSDMMNTTSTASAEIQHTSRAHARLNASSSHRWMMCPPSVKLSEQFEDKPSTYAEEGSFLHELCELKLHRYLGDMAMEAVEAQYAEHRDSEFYSDEAESVTDEYVAFCIETIEAVRSSCPDPLIMVEHRLDYSEYVPEGFGTGDLVIVADGVIEVIDFKGGRGVRVDANRNSQLMRNVAGLSATDAQKSSDMLLKCRYIDEITDSRGVVFATGTPVSNSMTELYTMMRYLQHDAIRGKGLAHFDCWASTFGETQTAIELAPEGTGYRARTRFAKFFNLPELMTLFKEAADIKTSDQLNLPTPTPIYHNEVAQPTEIQKQMVQELSERAARVHAQLVDPGTDNMLKITSDGRKLGLDQRIINPDLPDDPNSKVNRCVDNIHRIWQDGQADRLTQLVFCDLSTPKTGATGAKAAKTAGGNLDSPELNAVERLIDKENPDEPGFTVYDDIREKLVARGIPREQIAFIHEANTETRKKELFAKVRSGQVRVLMGSTFKMGAGMNVQDRLVALHDLDCPWRPGDLEQRSGRIIRQGNRNKEVHIYRYVTESTFDAYLWQTVENKQKFISQIMTSKSPVRSCEDVDETALSYAEIKALCAGDKRIKEKMDLDVDVARLKLMKASHQSQQFRLEDNLLRHFPEQIRQNESFVEGFTADMQTLAGHPHPVDGFAGMEVKGDLLTDKDNAGAAILEAFKDAKGMEPVPIGSYRGFSMSLTVEDFGRDFILTLKGKMNHRVTLGKDARGNLTRIDNALNAMPDRLQNVRNTLDALTAQMETAKAELGKPFPQEDELRTKSVRLAELNAELNIDDRTPMEQMAEDAPAVQSAKAERPSVLAKLKAPLSQPCAEDKIKHRNKEER